MPEHSEWFVTVSIQLVKLAVLSMILERALFFVFDYSLWRDKIPGRGIRAPVTLLFAASIIYYYDFDILEPVLNPGAGSTHFGLILTALLTAGGSAGAVKLFQDWLGLSRQAREARKNRLEAEYLEAQMKLNEIKHQAKDKQLAGTNF